MILPIFSKIGIFSGLIVFTHGICMCEGVGEDLRHWTWDMGHGESHSHPWHVDI